MKPAAGRAWRLAGALGAAVFALDQGAKALVEASLTPGEQVDVIGPVELTLVYNRGIAFGLASGGGAALVALVVAALLFVALLFARGPDRWGMWVATGLLSGGALGNLADRIQTGAVTDYIDILSWPPFNVADAAIAIGIGVLALGYARDE